MSKNTQIHMVNQPANLIGYNHLFPCGSQVYINKRVDDRDNGTSVYHGIFHNEKLNSGHEVHFDARSGKHLDYDDENAFSCYNIKLDISSMNTESLPEIS